MYYSNLCPYISELFLMCHDLSYPVLLLVWEFGRVPSGISHDLGNWGSILGFLASLIKWCKNSLRRKFEDNLCQILKEQPRSSQAVNLSRVPAEDNGKEQRTPANCKQSLCSAMSHKERKVQSPGKELEEKKRNNFLNTDSGTQAGLAQLHDDGS